MSEAQLPQHQGRSLALEMRTSATPEQVWHAWADPAKIVQWFADRAEGWAHTGAQVTWLFDEFGYRLPYHVVESIPGETVVFGGQLPDRPPFLLEVSIRRAGGETVVRLVNSGFLEGGSFNEEYEGVLSGWTLALAMLRYYLERHYGQAKEQFLLMRQADGVDLTTLPDWFARPERLNEWLTSDAVVGGVGEPCKLVLHDGTRIAGVVAAITRREAAYLWDTANLMVELKGWQAGPNRVLAARVTGWSADEAVVAGLHDTLGTALDRLAGLASR